MDNIHTNFKYRQPCLRTMSSNVSKSNPSEKYAQKILFSERNEKGTHPITKRVSFSLDDKFSFIKTRKWICIPLVFHGTIFEDYE